eukprot:TRINITY_DN3850_c0_g1_i2.p1 TRINITY_DN3850_c0_g1~~TRINITY_DN3850_c0_g1_i2.p1  ORF type:complete len:271 (+),score=89.58 TRINITY_DN3850_c0_g1_i2:40-852(+)
MNGFEEEEKKGFEEDEKNFASSGITDDDIMNQEEALRTIVAEQQPLIGFVEPGFANLEAEFANNPRFLAKIQELSRSYMGFRRVRGDGNCFYRAFVLGTLEYAIRNRGFLGRLMTNVGSSRERLIDQGFPDYAVDDFWEVFIEQIQWIDGCDVKSEEMAERMRDKSTSDYLVTYARFLTSYHLQSHPEQFAPFVPDGSIMNFVRTEVEPMTKEADNLQCVALAAELGVTVRIEQLTQGDDGPLSHVVYGDGEPMVHLLYRPGHYDILYPF